MYTLLIVDDEEEVREGLAKIIPWSDLGFELVGKLEDGREAIQHLKRQPVHAILSDIKMSFESGLSVAKYVYDHNLRTKVVLLSGYKEFTFAHEAIKYAVRHYLLKPSDLHEIKETFGKIKIELDDEHSGRRIPTSVSIEAEVPSFGEVGSFIRKAKQFIDQECHRDISLKEVADHIHLNPMYFSRLFKEQTKQNYSEYLTRARIEKAEQLLKETTCKIYEICERVGYRDIKHFHKIFKKINGLTPSDYRKKFG